MTKERYPFCLVTRLSTNESDFSERSAARGSSSFNVTSWLLFSARVSRLGNARPRLSANLIRQRRRLTLIGFILSSQQAALEQESSSCNPDPRCEADRKNRDENDGFRPPDATTPRSGRSVRKDAHRLIRLLCSSSMRTRGNIAMHSSFVISLSDKSMESN